MLPAGGGSSASTLRRVGGQDKDLQLPHTAPGQPMVVESSQGISQMLGGQLGLGRGEPLTSVKENY